MFESHLKAIDMNCAVDNVVPTVIHDRYAYVPLEFFAEFLNEVSEENGKIFAVSSMCELAIA